MLISSAIQAQNLSIELVPTTYTGNYHVSCNGAANGSITANHENTNPPFTYLWSTGATTKSISGIQAGTYSVTVTDANSNTGTAQLTLTQPNVLSSEKVVSEYGQYQISVHAGSNGSISVTPTGGTSSYTIHWNDNDDKFNRNGLAAGSYSYVITDANGCTAQVSSTLTQPAPLQLSFSNVTGVSCNGFEDGSVQLSVTGGISPYQILWQNGSFSENPDNLDGGINGVHVSDAFNNQITGQVNIPEPDPIQAELQSPQFSNGFHVSCYDCFNGSIASTVSGGTAPYTYLWDGSGSGQTTANISNLNAGDYILLVTDAHNCILEEAIKLRMPERQDWSMNGNTGTDPSTQFIGTTDSVDVVFKSNNVERVRIGADGKTLISGTLSLPQEGNNEYMVTDADGTVTEGSQSDFKAKGLRPDPNDCLYQSAAPGSPQPTPTWTAEPGKIYTCPNVGIGTMNPQYSLDVQGTINASEIYKNGARAAQWSEGNPNISDICYTDGNVGIGTCAPTNLLHLEGNNATIRIHDNTADPGEATNNNLIQAANGALRVISDNGIIFFLDSDNNNGGNSSKSFRIMKDSHQDDANGKDLLLLTEEGRLYINGLFIKPTDPNFRYPDYVFKKGYKLTPLLDLKAFFEKEEHLPGIKSEKDVLNEGGYSLNDLALQLLRKQEETMLYLIQLKEENDALKKELAEIKGKLN